MQRAFLLARCHYKSDPCMHDVVKSLEHYDVFRSVTWSYSLTHAAMISDQAYMDVELRGPFSTDEVSLL